MVRALLGGAGKPAFARRVVVLRPGARRPYRADEWRAALVVVERGVIELERVGQPSGRFKQGDLLWLADLGLRAIHNPGPGPAVLTALTRGASRDFPT